MKTPSGVPVIGFAAYSGTGKTTLLARVIPLLRDEGLRMGLIKHAHHRFDVDTPGKDSFELRAAGAERVLLGSKKRWALMVEREQEEEPRLSELIRCIPDEGLDLLLVEGFKDEAYPKIELHRPSRGLPMLAGKDDSVLAVASDEPLELTVPCLDLNDPVAITRFVMDYLRSATATALAS